MIRNEDEKPVGDLDAAGTALDLSLIIFELSGGAGRVAVNLANELTRMGHHVVVYCGRQDQVLAAELQVESVTIPARRLLPFALKVMRIRSSLTDLCLVFNPLTGALLTPALRRNGRRRILWRILTAPAPLVKNRRSRFKRWAIRCLLTYSHRYCDMLIANSNGSLRSFYDVCDGRHARDIVIYNPVLGRPLGIDVPVADLRTRLGIPRGSVIVCGAGRLVDQKGFDLLIKAFAMCTRSLPAGSKLVIFGEGPNRVALERLAAEKGVAYDVVLFGQVENLRGYLQQADLFVCSSRFEGFGNVLVEALSVGLRVVSTDCESGPAEILDNGRYGVLVSQNPSSIASGILNAITLRADRELLVSRAKEFDARSIVKEYERVLRMVATKESEG